MNDAKLTIRLPASDLAFARAYAREHRLTVTALVHRLFVQLRGTPERDVPQSLIAIAALVPPGIDARADYVASRQEKHG